MLLETIALLNPDLQRRKELELENQQNGFSLVEMTTSYLFSNKLVNVSHIDNIETVIVSELMEISKLRDNWNNTGTRKINADVINNALNIVNLLRPTVLCHLSSENVYPSKFGTIIMDWDFGDGNLFSLEIAKKSIGYFTEFNDDPQIQVDNIPFNYDNNNLDIINAIHSDIAQFIS